jgi:hypothetical protein
MSTSQVISDEFIKLSDQLISSLQNVKTFAVSEAWKILQIMTSSLIQLIEKVGVDLSGAEKKELALKLLSDFYDRVFLVVDIPLIPNILEVFLHKYVKGFLMILVGASIDALVATFKQTGIFLRTETNNSNSYQSPQTLNIILP